MSGTEFRPFWISWKNGHIEVGRGHEIRDQSTRFNDWIDANPLQITEIFVASPVPFIFHGTISKFYSIIWGLQLRFNNKTTEKN